MTLYKRGKSDSRVEVSEYIYICDNCNHTEIAKNLSKKDKKCPKCKSNMTLLGNKQD